MSGQMPSGEPVEPCMIVYTRVPYKCVVCDGEGVVRPKYDTTSSSPITCHGCSGSGIIWDNGAWGNIPLRPAI